MTENAAARFFSSAFCNFPRHDFPDPAETKFAAFHVTLYLFAMFWSRAFSDHHNCSQITSRLTRLDHAGDLVEIEWNFWNQNNVRPPSDAAMQRDPAGMASHYFAHHDSPVAGRRCMHPIECVHYDSDSRIESECCRSGLEIVVDGLGDADAIDASFLQLLRRDHRTITADNDQRPYLKLIQYLLCACNDVLRHNRPIASTDFGNEMPAIRRADDRAAQRHDPVNALAIENNMIAGRKKSFESVTKTNHFPPKFLRRQYHASQNRVKSGAIATAGQNANPWLHFLQSKDQCAKAFSLNRRHDRQRPIGRITANRVAKGLCLHRIDLCCLGARSSNDADTLFPSDPGEQLPPDDWHTGSNNHRIARCDLF